MTYIPHGTSSLKRILDVPEDYEIAALVPIGYPTDYFVKQKTAKIEEKIHHDKWK